MSSEKKTKPAKTTNTKSSSETIGEVKWPEWKVENQEKPPSAPKKITQPPPLAQEVEEPQKKSRFTMSRGVIAAIGGACVLVALLISALVVCLVEKFGNSKPLTSWKNARMFKGSKASKDIKEVESDIELEPLMQTAKSNTSTIPEGNEDLLLDANGSSNSINPPFANTSNNASPGGPSTRRRTTRLLDRLLTSNTKRQVVTGSGHTVTYSKLPTRPVSSEDDEESEGRGGDSEGDEF